MNKKFAYIWILALVMLCGAAMGQRDGHVTVGGSVFGGGNLAPVAGNTEVKVNQNNAVVTGDVYGGGALANVGTNGDNTTTVHILDGIINGNVYGGGLGDSIGNGYFSQFGNTESVAALVYGKVTVNIGAAPADQNSEPTGHATLRGDVFGCNNVNGTPKDDVSVNIWRTAHTDDNKYPVNDQGQLTVTLAGLDVANPDAPEYNQKFAINAVYGGGNKASYVPNAVTSGNPHSTTVYVYGCEENTVKTVYGGGNAANVGTNSITAHTNILIDGGRFDRVFGGGNGYSADGNHTKPYLNTDLRCVEEATNRACEDYNPGANIYGTASTTINGGLYRQVFGGSNQYGDLNEVALVIDNACDTLLIFESFGGANEAEITANVETTLRCSDYVIGTFYGGSNLADINGDVTLNVLGGNYENVFGGSKGRKGDTSTSPETEEKAANINGNVTLNLNGGTMVNAFGGNDVIGRIRDTITVNLLDLEDANCPLVVDTIYGGGRDAAYAPDSLSTGEKIVSPVVNLWHGTVGHTANNVTTPGCVFGGGKGETAVVTAHPKVMIGDTITGHENNRIIIYYDDNSRYGNIFGGGNAAPVDGIDSVLMLKDNSLVGNLFGGGNAAEADTAVVIMNVAASVDTIFGGGNLAGLGGTAWVEVSNGTAKGGVYGGSNKSGTVTGDITVNVFGSADNHTTVGAANASANIHGGGYGQDTRTKGHVTVNFGDTPATHSEYPKVYGDIYGGSALGWVNDVTDGNIDTTMVNILNGNVYGNVYGGGLGKEEGDIKAKVNGKVFVNVGTIENSSLVGNACFSDTSAVFGCNNANGSPQDSVFVNIYATHHGNAPATNAYPTGIISTLEALATNSTSQTYAIQAVYGGGNLAAYTPLLANDDPRSTTVHVYGCTENTVKEVYGGGNAADVGTSSNNANTFIVIDGGRINRVFGGGKGDNTSNPQVAANIHGTATTTINAGLIDTIFGGGNMKGTIDSISLVLAHGSSCTNQIYNQVFGGANEAELDNNLVTTINCGVGTIGDVYGGSNKAKITGDVKLSINGGDIRYVYGGSKGDYTNNIDAEIDGSTQLNIYGGTIRHAFGGSNLLGSVKGQITVNVLDTVSLCQLSLDTVYGGGNLAPYQPTDPTISSPSVNIIHGTVNKFVYGGGLGSSAVVTANPKVTIGYDVTTMSSLVTSITASGYSLPDSPQAKVIEDVFGGGDAAAVTGSTTVTLQQANSLVNRLFGGGNNITTAGEGVNGSNVRMTGGTVGNNLYGGCNENGTVKTTSSVIITNGTVTGSVFGGGYGQGTSVKGKATVHISGTSTTVNGDVFGGGDNGTVNGGTEVKIQASEEP